jgi:hypothetical protein
MEHRLAVAVFCLSVPAAAPLRATPLDPAAQAELDRLATLVPRVRPVPLPRTAGTVALHAAQGYTIEDLRGRDLDPEPPVLGPAPAYDPRQTDDHPPGKAPYVAKGIRPFRFRHFHCEFNYGGWHNFAMADYASTRGFDILYPYIRKVSEGAHLPKGTRWLTWGGFVNWHAFPKKHGLPEGRYDRLLDQDLVKIHLESGAFKRDPASERLSARGDLLMIDQEHPVLSPERLRDQPWYPKDAPDAGRRAFEKRYYDGYAQTYISSVKAARRCGWKNISIYGWYPYGRTWGGLEQVEADPGTDIAWNAFGRQIWEHVDIVNNSVYCFYWSPKNVAYTLANVDMNLTMINAMPVKKPVRPYYWTLLHGGGGGWRWWKGQPLPDEDQRAMTAMGFFTGFDGFDTWNWSGTGNHHRPSLRHRERVRDPKPGEPKQRRVLHDVMFGRDIELTAEDGRKERFRRYDVAMILDVSDAGIARLQKVRKDTKAREHDPRHPVFALPEKNLLPLLRPHSEPVAAMIEGMALVKPLEGILRRGAVKIDVPAQRQFGGTLPVVRRVRLGPLHVLATYDPVVVHGKPAREVVLADFDGVKGLTLRLPADAETRIFLLRDP